MFRGWAVHEQPLPCHPSCACPPLNTRPPRDSGILSTFAPATHHSPMWPDILLPLWRLQEGLLVARQEQLAAAAALPAAASTTLAPPAPAAPSAPAPAKAPCPECKDSVLRSAVKGLSWRFFSTGTTILLAWLVLGSSGIKWSDMLKLGAVEFCCKYFTYFLHERVWAAIALFK